MLVSTPSVGLRDMLMTAWDERWSAVKWCRLVSTVLSSSDGLLDIYADELCDILMEQLLGGDFCSPLFVEYIVQAAGSNLIPRWKVFMRLTGEADPAKPLQFATILSIIDSFVDYVYQNTMGSVSSAQQTMGTTPPSLSVAKVLLGTVHVTFKGMRAALVLDTRKRKHVAMTDDGVSDSESDCDTDESEVVATNASACAEIVERICADNRILALLSIAKYEYPEDWAEIDRDLPALYRILDPATVSPKDGSDGVTMATKKRTYASAGNDTAVRVHAVALILKRGIFSNRPLSEVLENEQGGAPRSSALAFHPRAIGHHCQPAIAFLVQMEMCRRSLLDAHSIGQIWVHAAHTLTPLKISDLYSSLILTCLKAIIYRSTHPGAVSTNQNEDKNNSTANETAENDIQTRVHQSSLLSLKTFLHVKIPLLIEQLETLRRTEPKRHNHNNTPTQPNTRGDQAINRTDKNSTESATTDRSNPHTSIDTLTNTDTDNTTVSNNPSSSENQPTVSAAQIASECGDAMDLDSTNDTSAHGTLAGAITSTTAVGADSSTTTSNTCASNGAFVAVEKAFETVCASQVLLAGAQACAALGGVAACLGATLVSKGLLSPERLTFSLRSHGLCSLDEWDDSQGVCVPPTETTKSGTDAKEPPQPDTADELVKLYTEHLDRLKDQSDATATKDKDAPPPVTIATKKCADLIGGALEANAHVCLETRAGREVQEKGFDTMRAILCGLAHTDSCSFAQRAVLVRVLLSGDVGAAIRSVYIDAANVSASGEGMVKAWVVLMSADWVREVVWALGLAIDLRQILQSVLDSFLKIERSTPRDEGADQSNGLKFNSEIYELCRLLLYVQHLEIQRFSATIVGGDTGGGLARRIVNPKISYDWIDLAVTEPESAILKHDSESTVETQHAPVQPLVEALAKAVYVTPTKENVQKCVQQCLTCLPLVVASATQLALRTCAMGGIEYRTVIEGLAVLTSLSPTAHVAVMCYLSSELNQTWEIDTWAPDHKQPLLLPLAVLKDVTHMVNTDTTPIAVKFNSLVRECLLLSPSAADALRTSQPNVEDAPSVCAVTQNTLSSTLQTFVKGSALDPSTALRLAQYTSDANPAVLVEHSLQALMRIRLNASERVRLAYLSAHVFSRCPYALHTLCRMALTHYAGRLETVDQADALSVYIARAFACEYYGGLQAGDNSYLRQCSATLFSLCAETLRDAIAHSDSDLRSYLVVQILTGLSDVPQEVLAALDVPFSYLCDVVSAFGMEPVLLCDITQAQARKECADYYCQ